jgi:transposase
MEGKEPLLVADNAAPHISPYTKEILCIWDIERLLWPPNSPDLNAIEHVWDYIRAQIRKREKYPRTEEEMSQAWYEEWEKVLQEKINSWIDYVYKRLDQVIDAKGDNSFHG